MKKYKETLVEATLIIPVRGDLMEQMEHIHRAELELEKAGVTFDSGHLFWKDKKGKTKVKYHDWELDWSLKGAKLVFSRFKKKKVK